MNKINNQLLFENIIANFKRPGLNILSPTSDTVKSEYSSGYVVLRYFLNSKNTKFIIPIYILYKYRISVS